MSTDSNFIRPLIAEPKKSPGDIAMEMADGWPAARNRTGTPVGKDTGFQVDNEIKGDGVNRRVIITIWNPPTREAEFIFNQLLPNWISHFGRRNKDYSEQSFHTADLLGVKGQFADMWRKFGKLYKGLWLDKDLVHEKPYEIVEDLIGHCFLTLLYLVKEKLK